MKKVLFATTALVATAGVASAEVALSGWAEMGIYGGGDNAINGAAGVTQFFQDLDVTFTMTGETDGGLQFGASVDLDENGAFTPNDDGGATIFISGDFGTLTMGDTDGAFDFVITENVGNPGSIDDSETLHMGYWGNGLDGQYDGQVLRYDYSFDAFTVAVSVEMDDADMFDAGFGIGASYEFDFSGGSVMIGAAYQQAQVGDSDPTAGAAGTFSLGNLGDYGAQYTFADGDEFDIVIMGVSAAVELDSGFTAGIAYTDIDLDVTDAYHVGVSAGYTFDAISVGVNWGMFDVDGLGEASGYGIAAAYDLGGGASIHAAYGDSDVDGVSGDFESFSLGLAMSF